MTDKKFVFQRHIAHIKPKHSVVDSAFLVHTLNSPRCFEHAKEVARGAAQPTVTLGDLKQFVIPLCSITEQREIVRRVEALFHLANLIEKRVTTATQRADKLTQAILAKAFRGELVPTEADLARREDRDYEPASVLLERIRAERAASQNGSTAKRSRTRPSRKKGRS